MSDTPRTDAHTYECRQYFDMGGYATANRAKEKDGECVDADFARGLERELYAGARRIEELEKDIERIASKEFADLSRIAELERELNRLRKALEPLDGYTSNLDGNDAQEIPCHLTIYELKQIKQALADQ